jgi:hypothetical protein
MYPTEQLLPLWDVFISHASEDKEAVARPLAHRLRELGLRVWFDESVLEVGDSLRDSIDRGLAHSRFGVVIVSPSFFGKHWTKKELNGLMARETDGEKVILPVWHQVQKADVARHSPLLADRVAAKTSDGIDAVARQLVKTIRKQPEVITRNAFIMHVGARGSIDIHFTVTRRRRISEITRALPAHAPEREYFESDVTLHRAFSTGTFNCWGVPHRAEPSFRRTEVGDLVLIVPTIGESDAGVHQIGIVKAICPVRSYEASKILWPDTPGQRLFPWLFFFDTEVGYRSWPDFLNDVGYAQNWDPRGWYRQIKTDRFARFGGPRRYAEFLRGECGFAPL